MTRARMIVAIFASLRAIWPKRWPVPSSAEQMAACADAAQREHDATEAAWLSSGARPLRGAGSGILVGGEVR